MAGRRENRFGLLPTWAFHRAIIDLSAHGFSGGIGFNIYNEPMMDPRLFSLISYTKAILGEDSRTHVTSNGYYIDQQMIDELAFAGLDVLWISTYTQKETDRCGQLETPFDYLVMDRESAPHRDLDDIYTREPIPCDEPCTAPLGMISIDHRGSVILCCSDYESRYVYGNILEENLSDIVERGPMLEAYNQLMSGERSIALCRRCGVRIKEHSYDSDD